MKTVHNKVRELSRVTNAVGTTQKKNSIHFSMIDMVAEISEADVSKLVISPASKKWWNQLPAANEASIDYCWEEYWPDLVESAGEES